MPIASVREFLSYVGLVVCLILVIDAQGPKLPLLLHLHGAGRPYYLFEPWLGQQILSKTEPLVLFWHLATALLHISLLVLAWALCASLPRAAMVHIVNLLVVSFVLFGWQIAGQFAHFGNFNDFPAVTVNGGIFGLALASLIQLFIHVRTPGKTIDREAIKNALYGHAFWFLTPVMFELGYRGVHAMGLA
jgi:hypothetical protein